VVDSHFAVPEEESLYTESYPDGLVLLITGKFPCTVSRKDSEQKRKLVQGQEAIYPS
jgi:hypothetical protein